MKSGRKPFSGKWNHGASGNAGAGKSPPRPAATEKISANPGSFTLETAEPQRFTPMPRVTITVPEKTAQPYRFQLDREVVSIGRGSENDIPVDSGSVSVHHAEMHRIQGGYELRDVGSTNGIKADGVRHEVIPLFSGMTVQIGDVDFDFLLSEDEVQALSYEKPAIQSPVSRDSDLPPAMAKPQPPRVTYVPVRQNTSGGAGAMVVFLLLAALAFFVGMSVRYQKETGGSITSLYDAIMIKGSAKPAAKP